MLKKSIVTKQHNEKEPKKDYRTPKFDVFGTIGDITQNVGKLGTPDGASMGGNPLKTQTAMV